ncbi:membrane protein [Actinokineospora globicatena]|nr:membrane protein [Actinokineospora globicatena]
MVMADKQDKAAAKEAKKARKAASKARRGQIFQAFNMQRKEDKALLPLMIGAVVVLGGVAFGVGLLLGIEWYLLPVGIMLGLLAAVILLGRRVQSTQFGKAEGQPGAAGWVLENFLRGRWRVATAVNGTTQLDVIHRVVGRPGVVLVAEGAPHRVKTLLAQEKKRIARLVGDTPIYDVIVGREEGQVQLSKLQKHLMKLPNNLRPAQIDTVEKRLAAITARSGAAMPKGPMPAGAKMRSVQRTMRRR